MTTVDAPASIKVVQMDSAGGVHWWQVMLDGEIYSEHRGAGAEHRARLTAARLQPTNCR